MTTERQRAEHTVELLESVVSGAIEASQALASWSDPDEETDEAIKSAWHELSHYAADEDICSRDPEYAQFMRDTLAAMAKLIRQTHGF